MGCADFIGKSERTFRMSRMGNLCGSLWYGGRVVASGRFEASRALAASQAARANEGEFMWSAKCERLSTDTLRYVVEREAKPVGFT